MRKKFLAGILVTSMCVSLTACSNSDKNTTPDTTPSTEDNKTEGTGSLSFTAGTYTAVASGNNGDVTVEVTFSETEIVSVEIKEHSETPGICEAPFERIPAAIVSGQTLAVDTVSGATNASNAVLNAVADCVTQAGGDAEALKVATGEGTELKKEELSCDVVVVGAGAAGTAAALSAAETGAKVILIEKTPTPSGAGTMAGALFATNSELQIEAGETCDPEWLYDQYITDSNYNANAKLVSTIIANSSETVNWLTRNDVNLVVLPAGHGAQYAHVGMPTTAHGYVDGGSVAINTLIDKVKENGAEVYFETTGKELIFNEDKTVGGVIATTADGRELHINAGSVVLATGGFGGNSEMMAEVFGEKAGTGLIQSNTGDGIKMAWSAGAAELGLDVAQWFGMKYGPEAKQMESSSKLTELVRNPLLFVNNRGERFGNEEEAYESAALGTMMYKQPDAEMYIILTQDTIDQVAKKGLADVFVDKWGHLYGQGVKFSEAGHVIDLDADTDKLRTPYDYTDTIKDAVKCGVAINEDIQAIDANDEAIANLYVAGSDAGGMYGNSYVMFEGGTLGFAYTSGRLAGANAATNAGFEK